MPVRLCLADVTCHPSHSTMDRNADCCDDDDDETWIYIAHRHKIYNAMCQHRQWKITLATNLVKFGEVTPEILWLIYISVEST